MGLHFKSLQKNCLIILAGLLPVIPWTAKADFALDTGDVVEIAITGIPELRTRAMVDLDGRIAVPIVGSVPAAGLTIDAVRVRLQEEFAKRPVSLRGSDGKTILTPISPDEVSIGVAEYRPVYVSGDITKVGEVAYRPGLTVRQAIVIAGGYDFVRFRINNPYLETIDYIAEQESLLNELVQVREREKQIRSQLHHEPDKRTNAGSSLDNQASEQSDLSKMVAEQYRVQEENFAKDIAHLKQTERNLAMRAALLAEQVAKAEENMKSDSEDFENARMSLARGATSLQQVADTRRSMLLSASRVLQTEADAAQAAIARDDVARAVQKLHEQRRIQLLADLQESRASTLKLESRLKTLKERLSLTGAVKSFWTKGKSLNPDIAVHRTTNGKTDILNGSVSTPLLPGDVIEVSLKCLGSCGERTQ